MKIFLGIESSTEVASVALVSEEKILGEITYQLKKTHSVELLPMVDNLLRVAKLTLKDLAGIGVGIGPGSFTGLRIGIALASSLAYGSDLPVVGVDSFKSLAYNCQGLDSYVCPVIYNKKTELYGALYRGGEIIVPGASFKTVSFGEELLKKVGSQEILLLGDGPIFYQDALKDQGVNIKELNKALTIPKGSSVALLALEDYLENGGSSHTKLVPNYMKLTQAEEELLSRNKGSDV